MKKNTKTITKLSDLLEGSTAFDFGRRLYKYIDCGPWVSYILKKNKDIYYEAKEVETVTDANCVGVKVGSIVEGSDAEICPKVFMFPFDSDEFWNGVESLNTDAIELWHEANDDTREYDDFVKVNKQL